MRKKRLKVLHAHTLKRGEKNMEENNKKLTSFSSMRKRIKKTMKEKNITEQDVRHILGKKYEK